MKCYSFSTTKRSGILREGIKVSPSQENDFEFNVLLGQEKNIGACFEKVPVSCLAHSVFQPHYKDGEPQSNDYIYNAHPVRLGTEPSSIALMKPKDILDSRILIHIKTKFEHIVQKSSHHCDGDWETLSGNPETIVKGWGLHGLNGVGSKWFDGLIIIKAGDIIRVKMEGNSKEVIPQIIYFDEDGLIRTLPEFQYERMIKQKTLENGWEIKEWL